VQESVKWRERALRTAAAFAERLADAPIALPQMAASLHLLLLGHPRQVGQEGRRGVQLKFAAEMLRGPEALTLPALC
jgi:hypothetical protein